MAYILYMTKRVELQLQVVLYMLIDYNMCIAWDGNGQ
jgi:hypothetical protein